MHPRKHSDTWKHKIQELSKWSPLGVWSTLLVLVTHCLKLSLRDLKESNPRSSRASEGGLMFNFILSYLLSQVSPGSAMCQHLCNLLAFRGPGTPIKTQWEWNKLKKVWLWLSTECLNCFWKQNYVCSHNWLAALDSVHLDELCNPSLNLNSLSSKMGRWGHLFTGRGVVKIKWANLCEAPYHYVKLISKIIIFQYTVIAKLQSSSHSAYFNIYLIPFTLTPILPKTQVLSC